MPNSNKTSCCKKDHIWNPSSSACEVSKYFKINAHMKVIIDNSVITCDKFIDAVAKWYNNAAETVSINFNSKKATCKIYY